MKHGYHHVQCGIYVCPEYGFLYLIYIVVAVYRAHVHFLASGQQCGDIAVVGDIEERIAAVIVSLLGYIYGYDFVFFPVDGVHGL